MIPKTSTRAGRLEAAQKTVTEIEVLRMSPEAQEKFVDLLLHPPELAPALKRALKRHRAFVTE